MTYVEDRLIRIRNDLRTDYGVEIDAGSVESQMLADISFLLEQVRTAERTSELWRKTAYKVFHKMRRIHG